MVVTGRETDGGHQGEAHDQLVHNGKMLKNKRIGSCL
jgi:hypothetical protein